MTNFYNPVQNYNHYRPPLPEGGYKSLTLFKQLTVVHDFTVEFTELYLSPKSRTVDQMDQAGRSGKQNFAEAFTQKSLATKIYFLGVARGSLEELLNDYLDFLRQKGLMTWEKSSPEAVRVRSLIKGYKSYNNYNLYNDYHHFLTSPETAANSIICLINQTNQLLDQKIRWEEEKFIKNGGFRENLFRKRLEEKNKK